MHEHMLRGVTSVTSSHVSAKFDPSQFSSPDVSWVRCLSLTSIIHQDGECPLSLLCIFVYMGGYLSCHNSLTVVISHGILWMSLFFVKSNEVFTFYKEEKWSEERKYEA